ncbi:MAG: hypothetical protein AAF655_12055 [Bacteroidota bacterium]
MEIQVPVDQLTTKQLNELPQPKLISIIKQLQSSLYAARSEALSYEKESERYWQHSRYQYATAYFLRILLKSHVPDPTVLEDRVSSEIEEMYRTDLQLGKEYTVLLPSSEDEEGIPVPDQI